MANFKAETDWLILAVAFTHKSNGIDFDRMPHRFREESQEPTRLAGSLPWRSMKPILYPVQSNGNGTTKTLTQLELEYHPLKCTY